MTTPKQIWEQQQKEEGLQVMKMKNSGAMSFIGSPTKSASEDKDEEMSRTVLSAFRAKEEEIEKKKMEVKERVQAHLGRVELETKRLSEIREVTF